MPSPDIVRKHYLEIRSRNPSYSLRAFSKKCGISHTTLTLYLNGKRLLSAKLARKLARALGFSSKEELEFLLEIEKDRYLSKSLELVQDSEPDLPPLRRTENGITLD